MESARFHSVGRDYKAPAHFRFELESFVEQDGGLGFEDDWQRRAWTWLQKHQLADIENDELGLGDMWQWSRLLGVGALVGGEGEVLHDLILLKD